MASSDSAKPTAAYVSFSSFLTLLDFLKEQPTVPKALDRSLWEAKFSGSTGSRLLGSLRFLGLLEGDRPTEKLERLVQADQDTRKELLKAIFRESYGEELIDDITSMTPRMVDEHIAAVGTTEASKRHAVSFFVNGAKYMDLDIPATIRKRARMRRSASKPSTAAQRKSDASPSEPEAVSTEEQTDTQVAAIPQKGLHSALLGMLNDLPERVTNWSEKDQDDWLDVFKTVLKFYHPARKEEDAVDNAESS